MKTTTNVSENITWISKNVLWDKSAVLSFFKKHRLNIGAYTVAWILTGCALHQWNNNEIVELNLETNLQIQNTQKTVSKILDTEYLEEKSQHNDQFINSDQEIANIGAINKNTPLQLHFEINNNLVGAWESSYNRETGEWWITLNLEKIKDISQIYNFNIDNYTESITQNEIGGNTAAHYMSESMYVVKYPDLSSTYSYRHAIELFWEIFSLKYLLEENSYDANKLFLYRIKDIIHEAHKEDRYKMIDDVFARVFNEIFNENTWSDDYITYTNEWLDSLLTQNFNWELPHYLLEDFMNEIYNNLWDQGMNVQDIVNSSNNINNWTLITQNTDNKDYTQY
jgi:hypothetical protein